MGFLKKIPSVQTDAELVQAYKQSGSLSLLGELYNRYMDLLYGVCLKYLSSPDDAQDAVMAVFEELIVKLKKHDVENFKSWVYTVAKNHCLMKLRSGKRGPQIKLTDEFMQSGADEHPDDVWSREENLEQLEACLGKLSTEQRQVIELFYLQQKCYNEIEAQTGLPWNTVRSFIQNGRRNLKLCMDAGRQQMTHK